MRAITMQASKGQKLSYDDEMLPTINLFLTEYFNVRSYDIRSTYLCLEPMQSKQISREEEKHNESDCDVDDADYNKENRHTHNMQTTKTASWLVGSN